MENCRGISVRVWTSSSICREEFSTDGKEQPGKESGGQKMVLDHLVKKSVVANIRQQAKQPAMASDWERFKRKSKKRVGEQSAKRRRSLQRACKETFCGRAVA